VALPIMRRAVGHAAFVYLAFPNDPTLANLSALYEAELRRRGISCDRLNPAHFHCSLVYLDGAEDTALERIWNNLGLPLMFRVELVEPIQMGGALALSVAPDPALVRLQSDLYRLALENGCTPDANDFSNRSGTRRPAVPPASPRRGCVPRRVRQRQDGAPADDGR
jgi:hypothetical protein